MSREKAELCHVHEAAERLGVSVDEVHRLISRGELAAVRTMDDDRWFVQTAFLERMVRASRGREPGPLEKARRWATEVALRPSWPDVDQPGQRRR